MGTLAACVAGAGWAGAQQAAPFTARTRTVRYLISSDGHKTVTSIEVGTVARSSSGFVLHRAHAVVKGKAMPDEGVLIGPDGAATRILWGSKQAIQVQDGRPGQIAPSGQARGKTVQMNGVDCIIVPAAARSCVGGNCTPAPATLKSDACFSPEFGVLVHADVLAPKPAGTPSGGSTQEMVQDTYDFKPGEPDPQTMKVPDGFRVSRGIIALPGH